MDASTGDEVALKRLYLSLLPHSTLQDLLLSIDAGTTTTIFPADLAAEVKRLQATNEATNGADLDADGEGSPDPQPVPTQTSRAPSMPPSSGPRTRAGAARAYAASLATSKDSPSARPSPAPGGVSFPSVTTPEPSTSALAPAPQLYSSLVVHLPGASPPAPAPSTPLTPAPVSGPPNPIWQSPVSDHSASGSTGPIRNTPAKKTRTGVVGGYNPITSIGPSNEGLPSYEEMIVLAIMESQNPDGIAPKDVFAWMSARWPLNANFRPSASQALQKAYKRGRLEKVGAKYKLNPNWHGGATTNRTTRRPQSMTELPGNYAWAPPPVAPVQSVPPDPRVRDEALNSQSAQSSPLTSTVPPVDPGSGVPPGAGPDFDAQEQVANFIKALQDHNQTGEQPASGVVSRAQATQGVVQEGQGPPMHMPHLTMPSAGTGSLPNPDVLPPPIPPAGTAPPIATIPATGSGPATASGGHSMPNVPVPVPIPGGGVPYPGYHVPTPLQASLTTLASQLAHMSKSTQGS
ncbi:linker histone H1 and H5 family protein [Ceratobasidium sp. AG-Ba]|nr:linker histone H1 and H5 family protein [Ceratobasidium sp. AG-Ba]QRW03036.1 linker histone H1 and H5 family protein [Ceratobasidium sp. AG-Ba]